MDIFHWGENLLLSNGFNNARQDIEWMLCDLLKIRRSDIYVKFGEKISKNNVADLKEWINQRLKKTPVQYITGKTEFYGHKISVSPDVLIPRPETERLVDVAVDKIKNLSNPKVLEIGTGTGCIAIAIGSAKKDANILSLDISAAALKVAKMNTIKNNILNVKFAKLDFLRSIPKGEYDLIISNPPYIPFRNIRNLSESIRNFEPISALNGGNDGLDLIKKVIYKSDVHLKTNGLLAVSYTHLTLPTIYSV